MDVSAKFGGSQKAAFESNSAAETAEIAARFAAILPKDCFVALSGDLGAGKTAFVKGLAAALGVKETVKSPSFNIYSVYKTSDGRKFVHLDAYRLSSAASFDDLLLDEIAPSPRILCVEWPENVEKSVPEDAVRLKFTSRGENSRLIELSNLPL